MFTSRGLLPSGGLTMPCSKSWSIMRAAREYPTDNLLCKTEADARSYSMTMRTASSISGSVSSEPLPAVPPRAPTLLEINLVVISS